ncbi:NUDIX hydrolase [Streptomyces sp. NPDC047985]|uniref:NUDIX hydrolase n=1 Tax=Streptomyces sp. NPDC047985 TaxID=3155384 RepID=UPI0034249448
MKPPPVDLVAPPACRFGGFAWIPNEHGEVLTVSANDGEQAGSHRLPGGHAGEQQSSLVAMVNHVRYETGITPTPVRLLGTDWVPYSPATPAAMGQYFVYLCGRVRSLTGVTLPPAAEGTGLELSGYLWQTADTARHTMRSPQYRRFLGLWRAWRDGRTTVLHDGPPALSAMATEAL